MATESGYTPPRSERLVLGLFDDEQQATRLVERLVEDDFPMDRVSLLKRAGGSGDDPFGIVYRDTGERIKVWGEQGLAWGALLGAIAGSAGLFLVPGIGPLLAAGPLAELLGGALTGALLGGATLAGAAALTGVTAALHRMGIPEEDLQTLHDALQAGRFLVLLHADAGQAEHLAARMKWAGAHWTRIYNQGA